MGLDSNLISQFVKITNDEKKPKAETTVYGTTVKVGDKTYVKLDGSDQLTPVTTTTDVEDDERVSVMIKDHSATITGNMSSPAARTDDVKEIGKNVTEFEIILADKVSTKQLEAEVARIDKLVSDEIEAVDIKVDNLDAKVAEIDEAIIDEAEIKTLVANTIDAKVAEFDYVETEELDATNAEVENLKATYVEVDGKLKATDAEIDKLQTEKLDVTWANIDYSNIDKAVMKEFHVQSGLIENVTLGDGTVTGHLVGVTIQGDLIEGNTIKADKLVIKGEDGLYYKLNFEAGEFTSSEEVPGDKLHGSVIAAHSITAEKISVNDLVAFGAKIGGFNITDNSLYSGVKETVDNATRGVYMDNEGQLSIGDESNYIKYYKDEDGTWKLDISLDRLLFGLKNSKNASSDLADLLEHIRIGTYINPETNNEEPAIEMFEEDTDFKMRLTNTGATFTNDASKGTSVSTDGIETDNVTVRSTLKQGGFTWATRNSGTIHKIGLVWEGVDG